MANNTIEITNVIELKMNIKISTHLFGVHAGQHSHFWLSSVLNRNTIVTIQIQTLNAINDMLAASKLLATPCG
jgi:hypothetical protein